jgi:hypothetical protein
MKKANQIKQYRGGTHHRLSSMLSFTRNCLTWLSRSFETGFICNLKDFDQVSETIRGLEKTRGTLFALSYLKAVRNIRLSYLSGEPKLDMKVKVKLTRDGIPVILGPWIPKIRSKSISSFERRFILTILYCSRALSLGKNPDLSTIESPRLQGFLRVSGSDFKSFWKELGYRKPLRNVSLLDFKEFHFTTKAGPNGHALSTSLADLFALPPSLVASIKTVGGARRSYHMDLLLSNRETLEGKFKLEGKAFRKLFSFSDIEDKVRIIAIGDYWSQAALKPLHHYVFKRLKKIPQDFSFNQQGYREFIRGWKVYHSVDLTAFTDRFPIQLISELLSYHLPSKYVSAWADIMVGYPFPYKGKDVTYCVGTPMGIYSSWATSTRAHHFVIYLACKKCGIKWKESKYCMLGDDVLIGDDLLAKTYKEFIQELGVTFSPRKTHSSKLLSEFAKCYFFRGEEITPFPINALREARKRYYVLLNVLYEERTRGWIPSVPYTEVLRDFFTIINKKPRRVVRKLVSILAMTEIVMKVTKGFESAETSVNGYLRMTRSPVPYRSDLECENVLKTALQRALAAFREKIGSDSGEPLGELAFNSVLLLTASPEGCSLLEKASIPMLYCYGTVEERFVKIQNGVDVLDTSKGGDWPLSLKILAIPLSDKVFTERQAHTIARGNAIVGKQINNSLELLEVHHSLGIRR